VRMRLAHSHANVYNSNLVYTINISFGRVVKLD
jgi:hypothetical protein